jgi:hypothetical protein
MECGSEIDGGENSLIKTSIDRQCGVYRAFTFLVSFRTIYFTCLFEITGYQGFSCSYVLHALIVCILTIAKQLSARVRLSVAIPIHQQQALACIHPVLLLGQLSTAHSVG